MLAANSTLGASTFLQMTANQTTDLAVGDRIRFDAYVANGGSIVLDTIVNVGQVTFAGPGRYLLLASPRALASGGVVQARWYDLSLGAYIGAIFNSSTPGGSTLQSYQGSAACFFVLGAGTTKTLELRLSANTAKITAWSQESFAWAMRF